MRGRQVRLLVALGVIGIALGAVSIAWYAIERADRAAEQRVEAAGRPDIGGPFTLVDHAGRSVSDSDFRDRFMLIFFGYTYCPDVCPTELVVMAEALDQLGEAGARVQPIFITVDPERDTADVMAEYVANFHPRLVGLTGSKEQIAEAAKAYQVAYFKVYEMPTPGEDGDDGSGEDYLMNHSGFTYLMGPDGGLRTLFPYGTEAQAMAAAIRDHLEQ